MFCRLSTPTPLLYNKEPEAPNSLDPIPVAFVSLVGFTHVAFVGLDRTEDISSTLQHTNKKT